jgi:excisionase family DNA binding protein
MSKDAAMEPTRDLAELVREMKPVAAPPEEHGEVIDLYRALSDQALAPKRRSSACKLVLGDRQSVPLPSVALHILEHVAELLARGDSVSVVPVNRDLSTQEAAALLKVSRQYLVRLTARGKLPFFWVGAHRKVRLADVLAFKERREEERRRHGWRYRA